MRFGIERFGLYDLVHNDPKLNPPLGVLIAAHQDKKYLNTTYCMTVSSRFSFLLAESEKNQNNSSY